MKESVGGIGVDSGRVIICDPAYLGDPEIKEGIQALMDGRRQTSGVEPIRMGTKDMYLGVVVKTYIGDGRYPVLVEKDNDGRVISVKVEFADAKMVEMVMRRIKEEAKDDPR